MKFANSLYGTTPVIISVMMMYSTVDTANEIRMPRGSVLFGLMVSSAE